MGPECSVVGVSFPVARNAVGLARDARSDEIHDSTPRAAVEGGKVAPNRRLAQGLVFHPRQERGLGIGFPLDIAHHSGSWLCDVDTEFESSDAGTQSERIDGGRIHTQALRSQRRKIRGTLMALCPLATALLRRDLETRAKRPGGASSTIQRGSEPVSRFLAHLLDATASCLTTVSTSGF